MEHALEGQGPDADVIHLSELRQQEGELVLVRLHSVPVGPICWGGKGPHQDRHVAP